MALISYLVWPKHPKLRNSQSLKQDNSNKRRLNTVCVASFDLVLHENVKKIKEQTFSNWINLSMALSVKILIGKGAVKIPNHLRYNHLGWSFHCMMPVGVCSCPLPNVPVLQWRQKNKQTLALQIPGCISFKTKPIKNNKNRNIKIKYVFTLFGLLEILYQFVSGTCLSFWLTSQIHIRIFDIHTY